MPSAGPASARRSIPTTPSRRGTRASRHAKLVPVGKAYSGFTDEELKKLDHFVRNNTTNKFGPVRQVTPSLVLEVAFDGIQLSSRHKSGIAMRFPRIARIRWDKPADEADTVQTLKRFAGTTHSPA